MKKNFLKFGFMLLFATSFVACEKESLSADNDLVIIDKSSSIDSIKITKSKLNPIWNPEVYFGEWKLQHAYYNNVDYINDSTIMLVHEISIIVNPSQYGGTTVRMVRVDTPKANNIAKLQYWKILNGDVVFYDFYGDWYNQDVYLNNHFTLLQSKATNNTIECFFYDKSGPAYRFTRKMHCFFTKVKDY